MHIHIFTVLQTVPMWTTTPKMVQIINAQIRLQGTEPTTLNLAPPPPQQGSTNQSYSITNTCYTVGGCAVNVTQGQ